MTTTVAGLYFIYFSAFAEFDATTVAEVLLLINNTNYVRSYTNKPANVFAGSLVLTAMVNLNVGDYVEVRLNLGTLHGNENCMFGGYLVK